jgi:hypothetical protein
MSRRIGWNTYPLIPDPDNPSKCFISHGDVNGYTTVCKPVSNGLGYTAGTRARSMHLPRRLYDRIFLHESDGAKTGAI